MYPQEYIEYLVHFHGDRDYFECHEILEEYWKKGIDKNKNSILVAFILLAVSNYHHRRGNFSGASRTLSKALTIFSNKEQELPQYGYEANKFLKLLEERLEVIRQFKTYKSMNLPIQDTVLIDTCRQACKQKNLIWCGESDIEREDIVHKHKKRDRRSVVLERENALRTKHNKPSV